MSEVRAHFSSLACAARSIALILAAASLTACSTLIVPPAAPDAPVSVFVLDHGRHSSLVLPLESGGAVRYSYGDWDYYVLDRTGLASGLRALFRPTQAALGRKLLQAPPNADAIAGELRIAVHETIEIRAEAAAVRRLERELAAQFDASAHTLHYSAAYDVQFVHHPEPYSLAHNSNLMVARWLEALGCEIRGWPVLSAWRIAD